VILWLRDISGDRAVSSGSDPLRNASGIWRLEGSVYFYKRWYISCRQCSVSLILGSCNSDGRANGKGRKSWTPAWLLRHHYFKSSRVKILLVNRMPFVNTKIKFIAKKIGRSWVLPLLSLDIFLRTLCYKPEGRGPDSRWDNWIFFNWPKSFQSLYGPGFDSTSNSN
jgi:hypothetical protein